MQLACPCTDSAASCTLALSSFLSPLGTLILHTIIQLWTCRSYETRRSYNTAHRGMHAVPLFCKISVSTWTRLHVLILLLFVLQLAHFTAACLSSKTKFVATRSQSVPRLCSTHSRCKSLFFGDCQISSAYPLAPVGFLTEIHTTNKARQIDADGEHNRRHEQTEHAAEQQDSQQRVHNRTIQMVQTCSPNAATNLTPLLVASTL